MHSYLILKLLAGWFFIITLSACTSSQNTVLRTSTLLPSARTTYTQTLAALSSTPLPSASKHFSPTPTTRSFFTPTYLAPAWQIPVLQFDWTTNYQIDFAVWLDNQNFSFYSGGVNHRVKVESNDSLSLSEPLNSNSPWSYSPHGKFIAECSSEGLKLYHLPGRELVGQANLTVPDPVDFPSCNQFIQWKSDDSAFEFPTHTTAFNADKMVQSSYIWKTGQPKPQFLATYSDFVGGRMSPNLLRLAYVTGWERDKPQDAPRPLVDILDIETGKVIHLQFNDAGQDIYLNWLTDEVLSIQFGRSTTKYYDFKTGQYLFDFFDEMNCCGFHQSPTVSPNQRWVTIDHASPSSDIVKSYRLFDLQTKTLTELTSSPSSRLSFNGWKPDSSRLYLVNSPAKAFTAVDSPLPAGLLAYDPLTHKADVLVPDAVRAFFSPDMKYAWVIRQQSANQPVFASLYTAASGKFSGEIYVQVNPIEGDPAADFLGLHFDLKWSHNSTHVVLYNDREDLYLFTGMASRLISTGNIKGMSWSPNDYYLMVYSPHNVWIVQPGG
jgi:hypothetical protein